MFKAYLKNGVWCGVYYLDGRSVAEFYHKVDSSSFTNGEQRSLLDANREKSAWGDPVDTEFGRHWARDDGNALASYAEKGSPGIIQTQFLVSTPAFSAEYEKYRAAKDKKGLDGF